MKEIIRRVAAVVPLALSEIDIDSAPELQEQFGSEVPVLLIDGRKAFKYTLTAADLQKRLSRKGAWFGKKRAPETLPRS
jgi:hypothetical protein